jgi:hypothetical protein
MAGSGANSTQILKQRQHPIKRRLQTVDSPLPCR